MKKQPKAILTNQDPRIMEAILKELPITKHAFCIWNITTKFSGWFTSILRNQYSNWCIEFYKLYRLDSCEEFEGQWTQVMEKYDMLTVGAEAQNLCVLGFGLVIAQIGKF